LLVREVTGMTGSGVSHPDSMAPPLNTLPKRGLRRAGVSQHNGVDGV
jgi:hypothetical protein